MDKFSVFVTFFTILMIVWVINGDKW